MLGPEAVKLEGPVQLKLPVLNDEAVNDVVVPLHIELLPAIEGVLGREFTVNILVDCEEQLFEFVKVTVYVPAVEIRPELEEVAVKPLGPVQEYVPLLTEVALKLVVDPLQIIFVPDTEGAIGKLFTLNALLA